MSVSWDSDSAPGTEPGPGTGGQRNAELELGDTGEARGDASGLAAEEFNEELVRLGKAGRRVVTLVSSTSFWTHSFENFDCLLDIFDSFNGDFVAVPSIPRLILSHLAGTVTTGDPPPPPAVASNPTPDPDTNPASAKPPQPPRRRRPSSRATPAPPPSVCPAPPRASLRR